MTQVNGRTDHDPTRPKQADKSLGELFGDLSEEFTGLLQAQVELAKVELKEEATEAAKTAGMFAGAGFSAYLAVLLFSFALAWALENVMDAGWAFFIVGALWAIAAVVLYAQARARAKRANFVPKQTVSSLKEDMQWARQKLS